MADAFIRLVDDAANTGKYTDTSSLTVGANTAHRQRINISDPTTAAALAGLTQFHTSDNAALGTFYALAAGAVNLGLNTNGNLDRLKVHQGDGQGSTGYLASAQMLAQQQLAITATNSPTSGATKTITMASTTGIKVGALVLVSAGGNSEYARVNTVTVNTSIVVDNLVNSYTTPAITPIQLNTVRDVSPIGSTAGGTAAVGLLPPGTPITASNTGAATALNTTLAGTAGKTTYLTGFTISGLGATAAGSIQITTTGLANNLTFTLPIPAGATNPVAPLDIRFPAPIPASAVNTAIVINVPSFGAGNTVASVSAYGFQL